MTSLTLIKMKVISLLDPGNSKCSTPMKWKTTPNGKERKILIKPMQPKKSSMLIRDSDPMRTFRRVMYIA